MHSQGSEESPYPHLSSFFSPSFPPSTALLDRAETSVLVQDPGGSGCQSRPARSEEEAEADAAGGAALLLLVDAAAAVRADGAEAVSAVICGREGEESSGQRWDAGKLCGFARTAAGRV